MIKAAGRVAARGYYYGRMEELEADIGNEKLQRSYRILRIIREPLLQVCNA